MDTLILKVGDQTIVIARTPVAALTPFRNRLALGEIWDGVLIERFATAICAGAERVTKGSAHLGHVTQNLDGSNYEQVLADFCKFNSVPMPSKHASDGAVSG